MISAKSIHTNPTDAFRIALFDAGLLPDEIVADGKIHRCPTHERPHSKNGWYVFFSDAPAGAFGDWTLDTSETWSMVGDPLPPASRQRLRAEMEKGKIEREKKIKAEQALAVNGTVAIPLSGDFNDLATTEGSEAVKRIIEGARSVNSTVTIAETATVTVEDWPRPLPLIPDEKPKEYPLEALPEIIGEAVSEVNGFVQCPVALTACSALASVSTVAAGLADVRRADKLTGPIGVYFLNVAISGERKSTGDGFFAKAIRTKENEKKEALEPEIQAWRAADSAWTAERNGLIAAIKETSKRADDTGELKVKLAKLEMRRPKKPKIPNSLIGDATSEALTWRLSKEWPVGGILSSEAGIVFGGHAMGRETVMRNLAILNSLWDGSPLSVDRRTSESYEVRSARLTLGLAVQPETIRRFIEGTQGLARGSGFLARFLVAYPESTQGSRIFQEAPEHWPALSRYYRRLSDLLDTPLKFDNSEQLAPVVLDLDPDAKDVWIEFYNNVEVELAPGGDMAEARDVASKAGDNAARLAALFHVFEHGPNGRVNIDNMQRACRIVAWHLYEALRFLRQIEIPQTVSDSMALESWIVDYCRRERTTMVQCNHLQKFGPNRTRRKATLEKALNELEDLGRLRRIIEGRKVFVALHPEIMGGTYGAL